LEKTAFPRIFPFALFMLFIGLEELARYLQGKSLLPVSGHALYWIYPVKAVTVGAVLIYFRRHYQEIRCSDLGRPVFTAASLLAGLGVFWLWINMDWSFGTLGTPAGFDLNVFAGPEKVGMTAARLAGAVLVVPIMEELFWRSFLIRYIIDNDFSKIPIGTFSWASFLITVVLFGLEHHYFLAGMMAGAVFNLLLYYTRSISQCILAHAVANLALGIYVLRTGEWRFW
jgi:CAAX prenyl protease-like protein